MPFRRSYADKLEIVQKAGLEPTEENVALLNSVSNKKLKRRK